MKKITNLTNSPIQLGAVLLPAFGTIEAKVTDYVELMQSVGAVSIGAAVQQQPVVDSEPPRRGHPTKNNKE